MHMYNYSVYKCIISNYECTLLYKYYTMNTSSILLIIILVIILISLVSITIFYSFCKKSIIKNQDIGNCISKEECNIAQENIDMLKSELDICANEYATKFNVNVPSFTLKEDNTESYTNNKKYIHMVIRKKNHTIYDRNTLLTVGLHELAHVLCHSDDCKTKSGNPHGPGFYLVLNRLVEIAEKKINYDSSLNIDNEYPISS